MWIVSLNLQSFPLDLLATLANGAVLICSKQLTQQKTNFSKLGLFDNPIITGIESNPNTKRAEFIT